MAKKPDYIILNKIPPWHVRQYHYWKYIWYKRWTYIVFEVLPPFAGLYLLIDISCWSFGSTKGNGKFQELIIACISFFNCHIANFDMSFNNVLGLFLLVISMIAYLLSNLKYKKSIKGLSIQPIKDYRDKFFSQQGWILKQISNNFFLINNEFNRAFRNHKFSANQVGLTGKFKISSYSQHELAWRGIEYFRRNHKILWNDNKVRLHMRINDMLKFEKDETVKLMNTNYFDYLGTAFYSMKSWLYDNEEIYDGIQLFYDEGLNQVKNLKDTQTAHHIGINALLITKDKKILIQKTEAPASPDKNRFAPSGSGSLDITDIDRSSFENTLLNGALREFAQETGWSFIKKHSKNRGELDKIENFTKIPLGMSIDLSRGMITDFFFLILTNISCSSDYMDYYKEKRLIVDEFEVKLTNAIHFKPIIDNLGEPLSKEEIKFKMEEIKVFYHDCNMLNIAIGFICDLLEDNSGQTKKLIDFLNKPVETSPL